MAIRYAVATGNWSNTATWDGGTLPAAGDEVFSNNFRVTIDVATIGATGSDAYISNGSNAAPAINAGGGFTIDGLTASVINYDIRWHNASNVVANHLLNITGTTGVSVELNGGFIYAASGTLLASVANVVRIENPNAVVEYNGPQIERPPLGQNVVYYNFRLFEGELIINANIRNFGGVASTHNIIVGGLTVLTPPKLTVNGNIIQEATSTSGTQAACILIVAAGVSGMVIDINGDVEQKSGIAPFFVSVNTNDVITVNHIGNYSVETALTTIQFLQSSATAPNLTINWVGSITRVLAGSLNLIGSGTRNITTNLAFVLATANDIIILSTSTNMTVNFYGNMTGGNVASARAMSSTTTGAAGLALNIFGNIIAGNAFFAVGRFDTAPFGLIFTNSVGSLGGEIVCIGGDANEVPALYVRTPQAVKIKKAITGGSPSFTSPYIGTVRFDTSIPPEFEISMDDDTTLTLTDPTIQDYPIEADVREAVDYAFNNLTGTLAVPNKANVSLDVPTDDGFGTGIVTSADFLEAIKTSSDPLAERLRNVATVQTVGDQFEAFGGTS